MFQRNKTPAVNPIQVLQAIDECNFRDEVFMNLLPRYGVAKGGGGGLKACLLSNYDATNDKNNNKKA